MAGGSAPPSARRSSSWTLGPCSSGRWPGWRPTTASTAWWWSPTPPASRPSPAWPRPAASPRSPRWWPAVRLAGLLDEVAAQGLGGQGPAGRGVGAHGVAPGAVVTDTVRRVAAGDRSGGIVDRQQLRTLQTPQVFVRAALREAHRRAAAGELADPGSLDGASDAVLLELAGLPVAVVAGAPENLSIATALDLEVAEVLAERAAWGQAAR